MANSGEGYKAHIQKYHNVSPTVVPVMPKSKRIMPERLTTRSKAQIVHDTEKTWGPAIMPEVKPWHSLTGVLQGVC